MKTALIIIAIIAALILGYFIYSWVNKPEPTDNEAKIEILRDSLKTLKSDNKIISKQRDSLLALLPIIKVKYIERQAQIASTIAGDSATALPLYRQGLSLLGYIPDAGSITNREIGFGAIIFPETYGLRLQVKEYEQIKSTDDELIGNLSNQVSSLGQLNFEVNKNADSWRVKYETESRWYNSRTFGIILGVTGTVLIAGGVYYLTN